ncbi:hypothetical protein G7Y89_g10215 [Cudoniella acicularis]|uniref:Zn(2)-C6 fungal-type domain-containing protein n=1 Tax=Cudoniella acicularis TaxID=354080 RepID=A0A8H4RFY4_9HELO|nr:hypothetical protein G7Y89_g10215 [Cudoniella acicularis]
MNPPSRGFTKFRGLNHHQLDQREATMKEPHLQSSSNMQHLRHLTSTDMEKRLPTRSKTGCLTCRKRKLKCDETRPTCSKCTSQCFSCEWPKETICRSKSQLQASHHALLGRRALERRSQLATTFTPLRSSLRETLWECANSVALTPSDRHSLDFFSSSVTCGRYGFGQWCTLQYIARDVAPSSSGVLRMMLALSASEMHKISSQKSISPKAPGVDPGIYHYNLALKHLRDCLDQRVGGAWSAGAIIATIFFMVQYEMQFSTSVKRVKAHFAGLWAVISTHPLFQGKGSSCKVPPRPDGNSGTTVDTHFVLSCQLIVWLLSVCRDLARNKKPLLMLFRYTDVMATSSGASTSLLRRLTNSKNPYLAPSQLYRTAQAGFCKLWGERPPPTQELFSMDINRPVELGQQVLSIRFNIWELRSQGKRGEGECYTSASLLEKLLQLGKEYIDVIQLAETTATIPKVQTMETVTRTVASYWACILFYRRMLGDPGPQNHIYQNAVAKLTDLLYLHYEHDQSKSIHSRLVWPTFIATIEVHDRIHRSWLLGKLRDVYDLSAECGWAFSTAAKILGIQTAPGIPWVDLASYMQSQDDDADKNNSI